MKLELKRFQEHAVSRLVSGVNNALLAQGETSAIVLSSVTGSGKTIMASAAIEQLLQGNDQHPGHDDLAFIWLSDSPELNEQTRRKMLRYCSTLSDSDLVVMDETFDAPSLAPGKVYFLNIQKLAKSSKLLRTGDYRSFTAWDFINQTLDVNPHGVALFIDEAHRGSLKRARDHNTILQRFIHGSDEVAKIPIVVGISATPERFDALIEQSGRVRRAVPVDPKDVRKSGLIKEQILLHYPDQRDDFAVLDAAIARFQDVQTRWATWCEREAVPPVRPLLVIQIADGSQKTLTKSPIDGIVEQIVASGIPTSRIRHSLQDKVPLHSTSGEIHYCPPSDISDDPTVDVILFKASLSTGWDCPRAEVIASFRPAKDATSIAQLVGRMVRTPLARHTEVPELDEVHLFLPKYDQAEVKAVIDALASEVDIQVTNEADRIIALPASGADHAITAIENLPSYTVPAAEPAFGPVRAMAVARRLLLSGISDHELRSTTQRLVDFIRGAEDNVDFQATLASVAAVTIHTKAAYEDSTARDMITQDASTKGIARRFDDSGRTFREGLHDLMWRALVKQGKTGDEARQHIVALHQALDVVRYDAIGHDIADELVTKYARAIGDLDEHERSMVDVHRFSGRQPTPRTIELPQSMVMNRNHPAFGGHIFQNKSGDWRFDANPAEQEVLARVNALEGTWWLRNPPRTPWGLCIPYEYNSRLWGHYPDFIAVAPGGKKPVVWDPHDPVHPEDRGRLNGILDFLDRHDDAFDGYHASSTSTHGETRMVNLCSSEIRDEARKMLETGHEAWGTRLFERLGTPIGDSHPNKNGSS